MPRIFDTGIIARRIYSTVDEQMKGIFIKMYFKAKRKIIALTAKRCCTII